MAVETLDPPRRERFPLVTAAWLFSLLLLFAGMVGTMYYFSTPIADKTAAEKQQILKEWQKGDAVAASSFEAKDKNRDVYVIPVDLATSILAEQAKKNGGVPPRFRALPDAAPPAPPAKDAKPADPKAPMGTLPAATPAPAPAKPAETTPPPKPAEAPKETPKTEPKKP
jgi:hypothetical protein